MRSATILLALLSVIASGCTIFNRPDRSLLDGGADGGVDAGEDAGIDASDDGGLDASDANIDASTCSVAPEMCGNREDEDCDQLIDCADPDCVRAAAPECCDPGRATMIRDDFNTLPATTWQRVSALPALASSAVQDFGSGATVGMVRQDMGTAACLEAELGASVSFELRALACTDAECAGSAEVVFGPSSEFRAGSRLQDDLGIRGTSVAGSLRVEVTRGGTVVATEEGLGADGVRVQIDLALGLVDSEPAIVARITVGTRPAHENVFVVAREDVRIDLCPGLFLGIQGTGNDVTVDTLSITQLDCSNPSRVDPSDGIPELTATTFSASDWANGGIGAPAILARPAGDVSRQFIVLFDGSPMDRGSIGLARLPLSIGGADLQSGVMGMMTANCHDWLPRSGTPDPTCETVPQLAAPLITALPRVMQDPAMVADGSNVRVLWAGERSDTDRNLALYSGLLDPDEVRTTTLTTSAPLMIADETCPSVRSPQILPLVGSDPAEWLVLYVCNTHPAEVHAARGGLTALTRVPDFVLGPAQLGEVAQSGVGDIAAVVFTYAGQPTYRLWLLTHAPEGAVLSFVEGTAVPGEFPTFVPYAGNPILRATDPDLGPCLGRCELHGVAATRVLPSQPTRVQLMVERWDTGSASSQYALIPLRQSWPSDL